MTAIECPDGGACHHHCGERTTRCFRVDNCGPLSGVFPGDRWPTGDLGVLALSSNPIEAAVAVLDARPEKWDLYRTATKDWIVIQGSGDGQTRTHRAKTIYEVLRAAVASLPLPVVPRRPERWAETLEVRKVGGKWGIHDPKAQRTVAWDMKTKREALENLDRWVVREIEAASKWEVEWAPIVNGGSEGVDFRWGR